LYKEHKFSTRPIDEIKADIDQVALYIGHLQSGLPDSPDELNEEAVQRYLYIRKWMARGGESVFLQDANTVVLTYDKLKEILSYLREKLPHVKRVTTYGRVDSLCKFSVEQLAGLRESGLDRIHSGYESGSDKVLALIGKGYTKTQEIEAGQKVRAAGIELSVYYMPGAGGRALSDDNAIETADVVSKVDPEFVRVRNFVAQTGTELLDDINAGRLIECTDFEKMLELKKMIENIDGASGHLFSDHIINMSEDVRGNLGADKEEMLSILAAFEGLDAGQRRMYQLARRMGMVRSLAQFRLLDASQLSMVDSQLSLLKTDEEFEAFLSRMLRRYI